MHLGKYVHNNVNCLSVTSVPGSLMRHYVCKLRISVAVLANDECKHSRYASIGSLGCVVHQISWSLHFCMPHIGIASSCCLRAPGKSVRISTTRVYIVDSHLDRGHNGRSSRWYLKRQVLTEHQLHIIRGFTRLNHCISHMGDFIFTGVGEPRAQGLAVPKSGTNRLAVVDRNSIPRWSLQWLT